MSGRLEAPSSMPERRDSPGLITTRQFTHLCELLERERVGLLEVRTALQKTEDRHRTLSMYLTSLKEHETSTSHMND